MDFQHHSADGYGMNGKRNGTAPGRAGRALLLGACLFAMSAAAAQQATVYYEDALRRFDSRDVPGAIVQLKNALQQDPKLLAAQVLLADAYLMTGSPGAAETALEAAARLGADRTVIVPKLAQALTAQLKYRAVLDQISTQGLPPLVAAEVLVYRGLANMALGNLKQADQSLREAEKLSPDAVTVKVAQGSLMLRQGNPQGARALADRAVAMAPNDAGAWNLKASVSHLSGNAQAALAEYGKALALNPEHVDARLGRVGLLMDLRRHQEVEPDLKALKKISVGDPRAAYLVALAAARKGDAEGTRVALTEATTVLDQLPQEMIKGNAQLLMLGGLAHYGLGQPARARGYLEGYTILEPRHAGARKLLAAIMLDDREYNAVIQMLYPLSGVASPDPQVLSLLASAYMGKKQYQQATELFEQAARLAPDSADAAVGLGMSHLGAGRIGQGMAQLQEVFGKDPGQARAGMLLASTHLRRGEPAKAAEVARKMVAKEPGNLTAHNLLGGALLAVKDRAGARAAFTRAAQLQPNFLPAQLNIARLDLAEGKNQAARRRLDAILKASTDNAEALLELANLENREGRPPEAVRWLQRVRPGQAKSLAPLLYLVDMHLRAGDAKSALTVAQELETVYPENLSVLGAVGQSYLAAGSVDKARATFNRMSRIAGFDSAALTRIAELLMSIRAFDDANLALNKIFTQNPGHLPAQFLMAELDLQAGRLAAAEKRAVELRAANPGLTAANRLLATIYMAQKKHAAAVSEFKAALSRERSGANTLGLFQAHVAAGDSKAAIDLMQDWLRDHPQDTAAQSALAEAYLRGGQWQQARGAYEALLKKRGKDVGALNNLAHILLRLNDPQALSYAQQAYALAPGNPDVADTLGWILVRKGQAQQGLPYLRDARLRSANNRVIQYHLGVALHNLGRKAEARRELQGALSGQGDFEGMDEARALLQQR
jgi:putative PEP-CTERM system TPR-repeat lipoprotein